MLHEANSQVAMQNFAAVAVTAYGCGYSEDTLRQELAQATLLPEAADRIRVPHSA